MLLGRSPGPRALLQVSALSRGTRASLTASASGPSTGKQWKGLRPGGQGSCFEGLPPPTALLDSPPPLRDGQHFVKTAGCRSEFLHPSPPISPRTRAAHPGPALPSTFEEGTPARDGAGGACGGLLGLLGQAHGARRPCRAHRRPQLHQGQVVVEGPRVKLGRGWRRSVSAGWGGVLFPTLRAWGLPSHLGVGQDAVHRHLLRLLPPGPLGQRHRPQKLVRGAAGRAAGDTQHKDAERSPGDPALRPQAPPSEPARRAVSPPGGREGGPGRSRDAEWGEGPGR